MGTLSLMRTLLFPLPAFARRALLTEGGTSSGGTYSMMTRGRNLLSGPWM